MVVSLEVLTTQLGGRELMLVKPVGQLWGSGFNISEGVTLGINISEGDMVVRWSGINVSEVNMVVRWSGINVSEVNMVVRWCSGFNISEGSMVVRWSGINISEYQSMWL